MCLPLLIVMVYGCGDIRISVESGESANDKENNNRYLLYFTDLIKKYSVSSNAYTELLKNDTQYNYPFLRDHFKLAILKDFIIQGSYTVEAVPIASIMHKLSSYSIDGNHISIAYMSNDSSVQIDVINFSSMELVRSGKCLLQEAEEMVSSIARLNDSIYVIGAGLDEDASLYWINLDNNGHCTIESNYLIADIIKSLKVKTVSDFFEVIDLRKEEDNVYALVYVQSPRWDSSMLVVLSIDSNRDFSVSATHYLEFSTIEGVVNTNAGKLGIMGRRGMLLPGGEVIALDPFSAQIIKNDENVEILPHLNSSLYDSLTRILKNHYYAFTCFSGPTINIDEYDRLKSSHGFMFQNKILKGKGAFATVININDTNSIQTKVNLFAIVKHLKSEIDIYKTISVGLLLDGLRLAGKLGGSPLSKKEINNLKIDVSAPDEFLITTGYSGFGGCGFISADSLLCFAYIPLSVPPLSTNNTVIAMKNIPALKLTNIGKQEAIKTRLTVAIWTKK